MSATMSLVESKEKRTYSFTNSNFGEVRTTVIDGEPWFIAVDICAVLGYKNVSQAVSDNVDDEDKLIYPVDISGQKREVIIINEAGIYSLLLSSKLPAAKLFRKWVTHEVLPAIRKQGFYSSLTPEKLIEILTEKQREDSTYLDCIDKQAIKKSLLNESRETRMIETCDLWSHIKDYEWGDFRGKIKQIWKGDMPMLHKFIDKCDKDFNRIGKGKEVVIP